MFANHPVFYETATSHGLVRGVCNNVVDGDTADFMLDLGWYQYAYVPIRFRGVNTAETRGTTGAERERALKAKNRVTELLLNQPVLVQSFKQKTSFERFAGDVFFHNKNGTSDNISTVFLNQEPWVLIADVLVTEGLADRIEK